MTVSSSINRVTYAGNGATTNFAVNFYFLENTHLQVILVAANGVETVQTLTANYTVTGAGNEAGGSITMLVPPPAGTQLIIVRNVPATQETDYLANDPFPAESHERALDKLTMLVQQNKGDVDRAIKVPVSDSLLINLTLPPSADRAGKIVYFDNLGNVEVTTIDSFEPSTIAAFEFTGTGSQTVFSLPVSTFQNAVNILINGVHQLNTSYIIVGSTLTFSEAPPFNSAIEIVVFSNI
jgi:hypothetical protein